MRIGFFHQSDLIIHHARNHVQSSVSVFGFRFDSFRFIDYVILFIHGMLCSFMLFQNDCSSGSFLKTYRKSPKRHRKIPDMLEKTFRKTHRNILRAHGIGDVDPFFFIFIIITFAYPTLWSCIQVSIIPLKPPLIASEWFVLVILSNLYRFSALF